ncbi:aquaporin AQPAe.a-like [Gigantopelta aegis]|uniref:aquaporin AQPAe.a-like n=1 Tax=Gigantopelta aegis TaxID=1735272 RepID=UPI001B888CDE|nr:aquaporin AQPAe.a-like [Gigantopelta aegis]
MSVSSVKVRGHGIGSVIKKIMKEEIDDLRSANFWRAVFAEFLGCFLLVLTGIGAGLHEEGTPHPGSVHVILQAGFYIAVVISILGHVSGAHVNPALSIGFAVTRKISVARFLFYVIGQCSGAISGAALLKALIPESMNGNFGLLSPAKNVSPEQALFVEMIVTFVLVFTVFAMIDEQRTDIAGSKPLIIGLVVCTNIFFSGHISGGCMNPIRNLGPAVIVGRMELQWIYWVGPMVGGACGALVYNCVFSISAGNRGLSGCISSRKYDAVNTDDTKKEIEDITGSIEFAEDLPGKLPIPSSSVEKLEQA